MKRFVSFLPAAGYYFLIFVLSSSDIGIPVNVRHFDKAAHFAEYALLGFLVALGFFSSLNTSLTLKLVLSLVTSVTLAGLDEFHQFFVPWRAVELLDLLADVLGATGGVFGFLLFYSKRKQLRRSSTARTF